MKIKFVILLMLLFVGIAQAGIKDRLAKRLPEINKMKAALVIGENNRGYLVVKADVTAAQQKVIDAENADRKKIYQMLADKTGAPVKTVETRRAEQIAEKSKKGIWLQKPDGTWYKK